MNESNIFASVSSTRVKKFQKVKNLDHQIMDFTTDLDDIQIYNKEKTVNEFSLFVENKIYATHTFIENVKHGNKPESVVSNENISSSKLIKLPCI